MARQNTTKWNCFIIFKKVVNKYLDALDEKSIGLHEDSEVIQHSNFSTLAGIKLSEQKLQKNLSKIK